LAKKKRNFAMPSTLKLALEDLLRARRLQADAPPLRGEDRRLSPLPTGVSAVDTLLQGGFPRGQLSEVFGPASSGRTGLVFSLLARSTRSGSLAALVDPADRFDPASAAAAGVDLSRLLWLRGNVGPRALPEAIKALGTVLGSGLFEIVVLDLAGVPDSDVNRLPGPTWIRFQRTIEETPTALLLLGRAHVAHGPGGVSLAMGAAEALWSGDPPGRLLRGLGARVQLGRLAHRRAAFELQAFA
jgi:hypothetical protein